MRDYIPHSRGSIHTPQYCRQRLEEIAQEEGLPQSLLNPRVFAHPPFNSPSYLNDSLIGLLVESADTIIRVPSHLRWNKSHLIKEFAEIQELMKANIMEAAAYFEKVGNLSLGIAAYLDDDEILGISADYFSSASRGYQEVKHSLQKCNSVPPPFLLWFDELSTHCSLIADNLPQLKPVLSRYFSEIRYDQFSRTFNKKISEGENYKILMNRFLDDINGLTSYLNEASVYSPEILQGFISSLKKNSSLLEITKPKVDALLQKIFESHKITYPPSF